MYWLVQVGSHVLLNFDENIWYGYVIAMPDEASNEIIHEVNNDPCCEVLHSTIAPNSHAFYFKEGFLDDDLH